MLVMSQDRKDVIDITGAYFRIFSSWGDVGPVKYKIYCNVSDEESILVAVYFTEERAMAVLDSLFRNYEAGAKTFVFPEERKVV